MNVCNTNDVVRTIDDDLNCKSLVKAKMEVIVQRNMLVANAWVSSSQTW